MPQAAEARNERLSHAREIGRPLSFYFQMLDTAAVIRLGLPAT